GGIITSTQAAETAGSNSLSTGTLTASDMVNHSTYQGNSIDISGGSSVAGGVSKAVGYGQDSAQQGSSTASGINTAHVQITNAAAQQQDIANLKTSTTTEQVAASSGTLQNSFDASKVLRELN
ncbi:hypothetical protein ACP2WS_11330, partial [Brachymonas sp. M4Q-1]